MNHQARSMKTKMTAQVTVQAETSSLRRKPEASKGATILPELCVDYPAQTPFVFRRAKSLVSTCRDLVVHRLPESFTIVCLVPLPDRTSLAANWRKWATLPLKLMLLSQKQHGHQSSGPRRSVMTTSSVSSTRIDMCSLKSSALAKPR